MSKRTRLTDRQTDGQDSHC